MNFNSKNFNSKIVHSRQIPIIIYCTIIALITTLFPTKTFSGSINTLANAKSMIRTKNYTMAASELYKAEPSHQRNFMLALVMLKNGNHEQAAELFAKVETSLPLVSDYALLYQGEALLKSKHYSESASIAATLPKRYPNSILIRRANKLQGDSLFQGGEYASAIPAYKRYIDRYENSSERVEAEYRLAKSLIMSGDVVQGGAILRSIYLLSPQTKEANLAQEELKLLANNKTIQQPYSTEELIPRSIILLKHNHATEALKCLQSIPRSNQSPATLAQIDLQSGIAAFKQKNWKLAESLLTQAKTSESRLYPIEAESTYWLARTKDKQNQTEQAYTLYMQLASDRQLPVFAENGILSAAAIKKSLGEYRKAASIYKRIKTEFPKSTKINRAEWEAGWCYYLNGDYKSAIESFQPLLNSDEMREKTLYWQGRAYKKNGNILDGTKTFINLLKEYPSGFYSTWYRNANNIKDDREPLGERNATSGLPKTAGFEKPLLLASLGLYDEAKNEMRVIRKELEKRSELPALARIYLEIEDYGTAISLFLKNRPLPYNSNNMPLWSAGYPLVYTSEINENSAKNGLSPALVLGLMRAESAFSPAIRSSAGAIGLMQLMPATAKMTAKDKGKFNPQKLTEPQYNITLGTRHLKDLLKSYNGDTVYVIAAYNAGSGAVDRWRKKYQTLEKDEFIENIPYQETRDYVKKVYASAQTYRALYGLQ